ncbi:hypothetical protein FMM08_15200 [Quadrisphaera setariae]|uniref:Uncharacterized protein n=1 Tax=Quadrisphaera setariae TaxID=2593304 RepID=A0A5C8ZDX7_9ACTN|nr:hypothetical protein FMM08_15200 [Quadrisphaera setariae]
MAHGRGRRRRRRGGGSADLADRLQRRGRVAAQRPGRRRSRRADRRAAAGRRDVPGARGAPVSASTAAR